MPPIVSEAAPMCRTWTDEQLTEAYLNAKTTHFGADGHNKAKWNEYRMRLFETELKKRGLPVPEGQGKFNGFGSF